MALPDPLHPFIAHFSVVIPPVCFIISLIALFVQRVNWNLFLIILLIGNYFFLVLSQDTGYMEVDKIGEALSNTPYTKHVKWASFTKMTSFICLFPSAIQFIWALFEKKKMYLLFAFISFVLLLIANIGLYNTALTGHRLTYRYGIGIKKLQTDTSSQIKEEKTIFSQEKDKIEKP